MNPFRHFLLTRGEECPHCGETPAVLPKKDPKDVRVVVSVDAMTARIVTRSEKTGLEQHIRWKMARQLAEFFMENCEPIRERDPINGDEIMYMDIVMNDRGTFNSILRSEKVASRQEGISYAKDVMTANLTRGL